MTNTTVAIVGGGPNGLMALKNFREDGFDATLFESRSWVGGLWKHSTDESISSAATTIFNSSKYRASISDFPMTEEMDDFPTAAQLQKYFERYCGHFGLWPHIKLGSPIKGVSRERDDWAVEVGSNEGSETRIEHFDKVVFACGTFVKPRMPEIAGIEKFAAEAVHSMHFREPSRYKGKNVLVVGLHSSAQDAVTGLAPYASRIYLSHRSGVVLIPRYAADGSVYDRQPPLGTFIALLYLQHLLPSVFQWIFDTFIGKISAAAFPSIPKAWNFSPAPSLAVAAPVVADELYPHLKSGLCEPVDGIARITGPRSLELKSGRMLTDIDAIVFCTGYNSLIPVPLSPSSVNPFPSLGAPPVLYRNIFSLHPDPSIRNNIAFLCQAGAPLPGFAMFEFQAIAVSQVWRGKSSLPPLKEMERWNRDYMTWRERIAKKYGIKSTFYSAFVPMADFFRWEDQCAGVGLKKRFGLVERWTTKEAWGLWWNDRQLWDLCMAGLCSPAIFRLFDDGKRKTWAGARSQILKDNKSAARQQRERKRAMAKEE
ncbi:uncharacterized protein LTR77_002504 [Saxophila tyrrhenica]|uniref:Flavin-containing monooxygenase n=1 Tax=Saxophila tyrrhenica TaxID=1690608 RepID=A0AAV9PJU5_9PEZI|nr:hypothetical protein LTR77_002504 [Saxophila tyrrhenica]